MPARELLPNETIFFYCIGYQLIRLFLYLLDLFKATISPDFCGNNPFTLYYNSYFSRFVKVSVHFTQFIQPMKQINAAILLLLMIAFSTVVFSQNSNPKFNDPKSLSADFPVNQEILLKVVQLNKGDDISIKLSESFTLNAVVSNKVKKFGSLETVVLRSKEFPQCLFQVSIRTLKNNTINLSGRLLNIGENSFLLKKDKLDEYHFEKINNNAILQGCSM